MNTSNYCFRKTLLLFAFLTLTIFVVFPSFALAQQSGIRISPALFEETVDPGNVIEYSITLENLDRSEQLFYVFARNISGVEEGGVPIFANNDLQCQSLITLLPVATLEVSFSPKNRQK